MEPQSHAVTTSAGLAPHRKTSILLLILLIGLCVAAVDGLTRAANDFEEDVTEEFEYLAYPGAFAFAALAFPLILAYAKRNQIKRREALLLWLLLCTAAYQKDFAYIKVPGLPIYVTDVCLLFLSRGINWRKFVLDEPRSTIKIAWMVFMAVGAFQLIRGLVSGNDIKLVFRDFALVVYSAFMIVSVRLIDTWSAIRRVGVFVLMGSIICSFCGLFWFLGQPQQRRLIYYGLYVVLAFIGVLVLMFRRLISGRLGVLLLMILALGVLLSNARSLEVALILTLLLFALMSFKSGQKIALSKMLGIALKIIVVVLLAVLVLWNSSGGKAFLQKSTEEFVVGVFHSEEDPNSQFRLLAWAEAGARFIAQPVVGEGFGVPFIFERSDLDPRPHNTYLTVLYKMGLIGFIPLVILLASFFAMAWKAFQKARSPNVPFFQILILTQFAICVYGGLNLVLESPFLAIAFWVNLGLIWRGMHLLQDHQGDEPPPASQGRFENCIG